MILTRFRIFKIQLDSITIAFHISLEISQCGYRTLATTWSCITEREHEQQGKDCVGFVTDRVDARNDRRPCLAIDEIRSTDKDCRTNEVHVEDTNGQGSS